MNKNTIKLTTESGDTYTVDQTFFDQLVKSGALSQPTYKVGDCFVSDEYDPDMYIISKIGYEKDKDRVILISQSGQCFRCGGVLVDNNSRITKKEFDELGGDSTVIKLTQVTGRFKFIPDNR